MSIDEAGAEYFRLQVSPVWKVIFRQERQDKFLVIIRRCRIYRCSRFDALTLVPYISISTQLSVTCSTVIIIRLDYVIRIKVLTYFR